jgi:hypothetical protein
MGIISTTKRNYRRNLVESIITSDQTLTDHVKQLNIKDAMFLFAASWDQVTEACIHACWQKGLGDAFKTQNDDSDTEFEGFDESEIQHAERRVQEYEGFNENDMENARIALGQVDADDISSWLTTDDDEQTSPTLTDQQIVDQLKVPAPLELDDDEDDVEPSPAMSTVVSSLEIGLRWLEGSKSSSSIEVMHFRNILRRAKAEALGTLKQAKLSEYYVRNNN